MGKCLKNSTIYNVLNYKMHIYNKDAGIGKSIKNNSKAATREAGLMTLLKNELKENMTTCDIGANIGFVSLHMCTLVGPSGKVTCFEPDACNFELLQENIKLNGFSDRVECHHTAVGNFNGELNFYRSKQSNLGSAIQSTKTESTPISVPCIKLDEWFSERDDLPNFYKMDVEGFEVEILNGMFNTLSRSKSPTKLLIEVHPQFYTKERSFAYELNKLSEVGYKIKYVESAAVPEPDIFKERGYKPDLSFELPESYNRRIYSDIPNDDAIFLCSNKIEQWSPREKAFSQKVVRTILIERF